MTYETCENCGKWKVPKGKTIDDLGYEVFDYHRSMLFSEHKQATLDGNVKKGVKGRISFFKRLSIQKGSPAAMWEDVIFARIPLSS